MCTSSACTGDTDYPVLELLPSSTVAQTEHGDSLTSMHGISLIVHHAPVMHEARFCIMHTGGEAQIHQYAALCMTPDRRDASVGGCCGFAVIFPLGFVSIYQILRILVRVFSRLANIFVLLAQGLERGSYEPDVTGSIPVWDTPRR